MSQPAAVLAGSKPWPNPRTSNRILAGPDTQGLQINRGSALLCWIVFVHILVASTDRYSLFYFFYLVQTSLADLSTRLRYPRVDDLEDLPSAPYLRKKKQIFMRTCPIGKRRGGEGQMDDPHRWGQTALMRILPWYNCWLHVNLGCWDDLGFRFFFFFFFSQEGCYFVCDL